LEQRIILRHLRDSGAKIDEFPADSLIELTFGRDPACQIHYDDRDEAVGRRHARLTVSQRDPLELTLSDLSSRNGTFVNDQRIQGDVRLKPGDRVQLGAGGPQFLVDLSGAAETRSVQPLGGPATKVVERQNVIQVKRPLPQPASRTALGAQFLTQRTMTLLGIGLVVLGALALGGYAFAHSRGALSYKVFHQRTIMSCAYKAYGNPDSEGGRYWFARTVLQNTANGSVKNVKVSYQIPGFLTWTTPDEAAEILPNQTVVFVYYPKFPSKVSELRTRTPAVLETKVEYDDSSGHQSHTEKREFEFFGITEFSYTSMPASELVSYWDRWDNDPLLASYITDEDQAVKTFYAKIAEVSGGMGTGDNKKDLLQFIKSTYNYMVSLGMTYSGAKGVPDDTGDVHSLVQSIRMPRDLIYGNTGLCIELAQLWCALGQTAGLKARLVLIPGHAYTLLEAGDGTQIPVETTYIGGGNVPGANLGKAHTWEEAVQRGMERYFGTEKTAGERGQPKTELLQIADLQGHGIRPPELPEINRPELVKLLDDRLARHRKAGPRVTNVVVVHHVLVRPRYCPFCRPR
jgi:hypothetical protein